MAKNYRKKWGKRIRGYKKNVGQNMITVNVAGVFPLEANAGTDTQPINAWLRMRSLAKAYQSSSVAGVGALPLNNFDKLFSLFDEYRVEKIRIKFVPAYQTEEFGQEVPKRLPPIIIAMDTDNSLSLDIKTNLAQGNTVMRDLSRPFTLAYHVPKYSGQRTSTKGGWQNCQNDTTTGVLFDEGIISMNTENVLPPRLQVGSIYVEYVVSFKGRQDSNIESLLAIDNKDE